MSSIAITGGATGTGVFSLLAPSTSTNRTLTLPDSTGTVLNDQSNIEAQVKTATNASGSAPVYACRAWVNFNGTGTVAIRASGNVSSITDNGVGDYTVNFATAMSDGNYSVSGCGQLDQTTTDATTGLWGIYRGSAANISTTSVRLSARNTGAVTGLNDLAVVTFAAFR